MKTSLKASALIAVVSALGFADAGVVLGAVTFEHIGDTDPATEGFVVDGTPGGSANAGPPVNWRMAPIGSASGMYDFSDTASVGAVMTDPTGWTFTMTAKLTANRAPSAAMVRLKDATNRFEFQMLDSFYAGGAGMYYYSNNPATPTKIGTVDPTDGFHTYQMILDPVNGVNDSTDTIKFYVDGILQSTILRSGMQGAGGAPQAFFGKATSSGSNNTDQQYAWVRLETGQHIYTGIPEPTGLVLLGVAGLGLMARRLPNRRER